MLVIDFGSSSVRAAVVEDAGVRRVTFDDLDHLAAAVAFSDLGEGGRPMIGATAGRMAAVTPADVSVGIKRLLGQPYNSAHVRALAARLRHPVAPLGGGEVGLSLGGKLRHPIEIAARLLARVVQEAPEQRRAVISVPSSFDCIHRRALASAARIAGLEDVRLVAEPLAAALSLTSGDGTFLVCDLGAGVADFAVVRRRGVICEARGASADIGWGGDDIDAELARIIGDEATSGTGVDLQTELEASSRLRYEVRKLKELLATLDERRLYVPMLTEKPNGSALDIDRVVTAVEVRGWLEPLLRRLELPCREALALADVMPEQLDEVLLCGGGADLLAVYDALTVWAGRRPRVAEYPQEAVINGLVVMAQGLLDLGQPVVVIDRLPATLGLAEGDIYSPVLAGGSALPARVHKLVATRTAEQAEVVISLYQGESSHIGHNHLLGLFGVDGLVARPAGETVVELAVTLDESGLVYLDAKELAGAQKLGFKRLGGPGLTAAEAEALSRELHS